MPIATWNYKIEADSIRHLGPMAEDYYAAFGLGGSDKHIGSLDTGGVALAAIQGLHAIVKEKDAEIAEQRQQLTDLETANLKLAARLAKVETLVAKPAGAREDAAE